MVLERLVEERQKLKEEDEYNTPSEVEEEEMIKRRDTRVQVHDLTDTNQKPHNVENHEIKGLMLAIKYVQDEEALKGVIATYAEGYKLRTGKEMDVEALFSQKGEQAVTEVDAYSLSDLE